MKNKNQILAATMLMTFLSFSQMKAETTTNLNRTLVSQITDSNIIAYNDELTNLDLDEIVYVEDEEEIDLGFDPKQYLPFGFDAYKGMRLNLNDIPYIECEEEIILDFDVEDFLPKDFSPYSSR